MKNDFCDDCYAYKAKANPDPVRYDTCTCATDGPPLSEADMLRRAISDPDEHPEDRAAMRHELSILLRGHSSHDL